MRDYLENIINLLFRHWIWFFGTLALTGLAMGTWYLAHQGPQKLAVGTGPTLRLDAPAAIQLTAEIAALEKYYHDSVAANLITADALASLAQAVDKQRKLVELVGGRPAGPAVHLKQLKTELDNARARDAGTKIVRLRREGQLALAAGRFEEADPSLHEAWRLQREVNASGADPQFKSTVAESELKQAVDTVEAGPIHLAFETERQAARAAVKAGQLAEAGRAYARAHGFQQQLNSDYANTPYSDLAGMLELEAEIDSLKAQGLRQDSEAAEKSGDAALAAGQMTEAAGFFAQARTLQLELNDKYRRSRDVSDTRPADLEIKRQTAASIPTSEKLDALDAAITDLLRRRQPAAAAQKIGEADTTMQKLAALFPLSRRLDRALQKKFAELATHRAALVEIQRQAYDGVRPVPGAPGRMLLRTEVTQAYYLLVTGLTNPSRNGGLERPVDSVSWLDAQAFCQGLSLLLGCKVRLPTEAEYRAALGGDGAAGVMWSRENSQDSTQPAGRQIPNGAGFYDLLGNVAEWLDAEVTADQAMVAGGSYLDPVIALRQVPLEPRAKNDRARHIGFRFLIELPAELLPPLPTQPAAAAPNFKGPAG